MKNKKFEPDFFRTGMDQELLDRAQTGDSAAFGELYDRHHAVVWRFVVHRIHSVTVAEDLVQDTFLEILKHRDRFDAERGVSFETFLCSIADKLIRKHRRRQARTLAYLEWLRPQAAAGGTDSTFEQKANQVMDLNKATLKLPERQQEVLHLSDAEEFSMQEIVETVGITLPAVKSLLFRAREGMKKLLKPGGKK
ncbi:MAG: RNA polymerase sigma factor [Blastocatellia bacterium]|nr:RNA polymerase sigma factor [Blastocatellia bacterium]